MSLFLGTGAGWGVQGGDFGGAVVLELPALPRVPPPPTWKGIFGCCVPWGNPCSAGVGSSGGLRMRRNTKSEMQPWRTLPLLLLGSWEMGERKQVLERPFEFPLLGGLSALASSRDSSSSLCTFLFHPPQLFQRKSLVLDCWLSQETSAAALVLSTRNE